MKQIKWIIYTLYIIIYTSLVWITILWKGVPIGPNDAPVVGVITIFLTFFHIVWIINYMYHHWNDDLM